jgi:hypothetical protein
VTRRLGAAAALVFLVATLAALAGIGVRSTYGGNVSVDEPQYLLSAISLWEDHDLDIADELAERRWLAFHNADLPVQTAVLPDSRQLSPHDPLLPVILAAPVGLAGWVGVKCALALLAGATAALTLWIAVRRFMVPVPLATIGTAVAFASPPLVVYGQQVYPEMPAALAALVGVAAVTGQLRRGGLVAFVGAVVALPWLGVKYVPVAAALALVGLLGLHRGGRGRAVVVTLLTLVGAGLAYAVVHRLVWGGWTVYATGDHFEGSGEFGVVGFHPDYPGRTLRLVGLFVDRGFGLVPWQPAWLLAVPAVAALARRRAPGALALALPLAAGWATAVWVALTMHGWWWPGRQVVVVLPLLLVGLLWWLATVVPSWARAVAAGLAAAGLAAYVALLADGYLDRLTWVVGFERVRDPVVQALRPLLPDYRAGGFLPLHLAWFLALLLLLVAGWRSARPRVRATRAITPSDQEVLV